MPHMQISSCAHETTMSVYMTHMNSLQSTVLPQALVYLHFTVLIYAPEQIYAYHIVYVCPNALLL